MSLQVVSTSGRSIATVNFSNFQKATLSELKKNFKILKGVDENRQRFLIRGETRKSVGEGLLTASGLKDGDTIIFRDLGPQISWRTVFIVEYLGPLLIYPFFFLQPSFIYYGLPKSEMQLVQQIALVCWSFHYFKREFETIFIHRFSHSTMPIFNIFKNSGYYWGSCALVAYFVNHPLFTSPKLLNTQIGLAIFILCEIGNFICHVQLRNLRSEGTTERKIPRGFLFNLVSCPNYTFEILAWVGFSIMTQTLTAYLFTLIGACQMIVWAIQKHKRYTTEFKDYPRSRKIIFPFIF
eukprot:TRINITY_DN449_c1_g1_i1.p1 TRINITY_DN449_c1_g1~~TRINITY_DN449_c1_g1_i1.p1  ORF type:complete len:295 (-),score=107.96 TRINITY_DN449_c1_g1_i1:75-959(-)